MVEMMVSMALFIFIMLVLISAVNQTSKIWLKMRGDIEQFRSARIAFEQMGRRLSQATLNTYWDYDDPNTPAKYVRQSELRFVSGAAREVLGDGASNRFTDAIFFHAPLGATTASSNLRQLQSLLCTCGYFIEFGDDADLPPFIDQLRAAQGKKRLRFRLMEFLNPADAMKVYEYTSGTNASNGKPKNLTYVTNPPLAGLSHDPSIIPSPGLTGREWFTKSLSPGTGSHPVHALAENIIALIILPKVSPQEDPTGLQLAPRYNYDSTAVNTVTSALNPLHQLPPILQITMVAIDESSAGRLTDADNAEIRQFLNSRFTDAAKFAEDMGPSAAGDSGSLADLLIRKKINFHVFSTTIAIKGAKWSSL